MNLDEAVELLFMHLNANSGDIMVPKSPASTISDLAQTIKTFNANNEIKIIAPAMGRRYETLLTKICKQRT